MTWSNLRFDVWRSFLTMATNLPSCFSTQFLEQLPKFLVNFTLLKYVKLWLLITKELIFGFQILDLKDHFSACLGPIYTIPDHQCTGFRFISDWGFVYTAPYESAPEFGITLCVNTHTPEHFLYRIHENDPKWKVIRYRVNQALISCSAEVVLGVFQIVRIQCRSKNM